MAVHARPEPRFRRAYVQPVRRRWLARRRGLVVHLGLALVVAGGFTWAFAWLRHADVLRVDTITVEGNERLSAGEVAGLMEPLRGENLLIADLEAGRASLLASGWIREAALRRVLPSAVHVTLEEREPVGLSRFGSRLYLIDVTGHVIDEFGPRFSDLDLPIIDGFSARGGEGGSTIDKRRAALAARLIAQVEADSGLAARVSQVDVANPHDAVVLLDGDPVRVHLGAERFVARLRTYLEISPALRQVVPDIDYVDVRFDERVYVGPADAAAVARRIALQRRLTEAARTGLAANSGQRRQRGT